ncbi:hypothetical protein ACOME3_001324 [Neoechinorhynchus agilis]
MRACMHSDPNYSQELESFLNLLETNRNDEKCVLEFVRALGLILEPLMKNNNRADTLTAAAKQIGLDSWIVDVRHSVVHRPQLPPMNIIKMAIDRLTSWLKINFYDVSKIFSVINDAYGDYENQGSFDSSLQCELIKYATHLGENVQVELKKADSVLVCDAMLSIKVFVWLKRKQHLKDSKLSLVDNFSALIDDLSRHNSRFLHILIDRVLLLFTLNHYCSPDHLAASIQLLTWIVDHRSDGFLCRQLLSSFNALINSDGDRLSLKVKPTADLLTIVQKVMKRCDPQSVDVKDIAERFFQSESKCTDEHRKGIVTLIDSKDEQFVHDGDEGCWFVPRGPIVDDDDQDDGSDFSDKKEKKRVFKNAQSNLNPENMSFAKCFLDDYRKGCDKLFVL